MSIITKLHVDDKIFTILNYDFNIRQAAGQSGRPSGMPMGGMWNITIETTKDTIFFEWATNATMTKHVQIVQSPVAMNGKNKVFDLYDVYCISQFTSFNAVNDIAMLTHLVITPAIMVVDGIKMFEKHWKITDLEARATEVTTLSDFDQDPEITHYHIEDEAGNIISKDEIEEGDRIMIVVESRNAVGESFELDLDDGKLDYEYKGRRLKDDVLIVDIMDDVMHIPLKAVAQAN